MLKRGIYNFNRDITLRDKISIKKLKLIDIIISFVYLKSNGDIFLKIEVQATALRYLNFKNRNISISNRDVYSFLSNRDIILPKKKKKKKAAQKAGLFGTESDFRLCVLYRVTCPFCTVEQIRADKM